LFSNFSDSHYCGGSTPDALVWKDAACSRFAVDTDRDGVAETKQAIVLELCADGALRTDDGVALATIDATEEESRSAFFFISCD
tara:strand:- start:344 stop:595 length:252 start_codon:yes stop_codon:yes gene_type:complete